MHRSPDRMQDPSCVDGRADAGVASSADTAGNGRRAFLAGLGRTAIGVALGGAALPPIVHFAAEARGTPLRPPNIAHRWSMVFDLRLCDGCRKCTEACQKMHALPEDYEFIKVHELTSESGQQFFLPIPCMMCHNAPCYRVCPVGATFYNDEGLVLIDQDKCIGCRACIAACPYDARYFNFESSAPTDPSQIPFAAGPEYPGFQQRGTVGKCAFCAHLLRRGELPACVDRCSMEAIFIGDWEKDLATNGRSTIQLSKFLKDNDAFRFKDELNTHPSVYYVAGHGQDIDYY